MGVIFKNWQGWQFMMKMLIIHFVCWLGWLSSVALAQADSVGVVRGSVNFTDLGITFLGNLAMFLKCAISKEMLHLEVGARDVFATIRGPKLKKINGFGLTTCTKKLQDASVVMLCNRKPNSSVRQFMKYISNSHAVDSILVQFVPLKSAPVTVGVCRCSDRGVTCGCIVFSTVEEITVMLATRMPRILKRLSDSLCLLPSLNCLKNGCHGHHQDIDGEQRLTESESMVEPPAAVCRTLDYISQISIKKEHICICIPVHPAGDDEWTKMMIRSLRSKDKEVRGTIVMASDALKSYLQGERRGDRVETVEYSTVSVIAPRFAEVLVNLVLTFWFRVDGFSSAFAARWAIKEFVVDSNGTGFAANAFITKALVNSNVDNTSACQLLAFRGNVVSLRNLSFIVGSINLICSITWAVLIASEGGPRNWYATYSMPPSKARVAVIIGVVGIDCLLYVGSVCTVLIKVKWRNSSNIIINFSRVIILFLINVLPDLLVQIVALASFLGNRGLGRWVYSALQGLVWVKWGVGSTLQNEDHRPEKMRENSGGVLFYPERDGSFEHAIAFLLNAILAAVRGKWKYSACKGLDI